VDEGTLGVHKVELVVKAGEDLSNGSGVGNHAHSALDLGEVTSGDDSGGLVVDSALETSGAPVNKLDGPLGLDGCNSSVDILGDNISTVHEAGRHVLSVAGVALGEHVGGLEGRVGDLSHRELLVVSLLSRDDGGIRGEGEVDTRVGDQVGLELGDVHIEGTVEAERGSEGRGDLGNKPVEVGVGGPLNVEGAAADVIESLVVDEEVHIAVLEEGVGGEDGVVGLNNAGGDLGRGPDSEANLGLLAVVDGEALHEERAETRAGTSTNSMVDEEALETSAVVGKLADPVKDKVDNLLSNGVVATGEVVGGILLAGDQLLRVEELAVGAGADLVNDGGLEVNKDSTRNVLAGTSLREEGAEGIVSSSNGLIRGHLAIRLNAVLEAEELPSSISDLDSGLADVDRDNFTHCSCLVFV